MPADPPRIGTMRERDGEPRHSKGFAMPRPRRTPTHAPDALPRDTDGCLVLSIEEMCLLLALRDLPQQRAPNRLVWTHAALRYLVQVRENASFRNLYLAAWGMRPRLVCQWRAGRGVCAEATPLGRALPGRHGRAWIARHGEWQGFHALVTAVEERRAERRRKRLAAPIRFVRADLWGGPLDGDHVALRVPARDEITVVVQRDDGTRGLARYRKVAPDESEPVSVKSNGLGEPIGPIGETVIPRLEGKRGVRYRYGEMV
jgi:hypothetical protein